MSLQAFIARRLIALVFMLVGITIITFGLSRLAPGDPARFGAGVYRKTSDNVSVRRGGQVDAAPTLVTKGMGTVIRRRNRLS